MLTMLCPWPKRWEYWMQLSHLDRIEGHLFDAEWVFNVKLCLLSCSNDIWSLECWFCKVSSLTLREHESEGVKGICASFLLLLHVAFCYIINLLDCWGSKSKAWLCLNAHRAAYACGTLIIFFYRLLSNVVGSLCGLYLNPVSEPNKVPKWA